MSQSQNLKIPTPLHAQIKALAAARGVGMTTLLHQFVRQAVEAGEIPDEVPGFSVTLLLDLDAEDHGPFVVITTPNGDLPRMTRGDAEVVARFLADPQPRTTHNRAHRNGHWTVANVGTGIKITGKPHTDEPRIEAVMTPAYASELARKVESIAGQAIPTA